jgi:hypothetical protein
MASSPTIDESDLVSKFNESSLLKDEDIVTWPFAVAENDTASSFEGPQSKQSNGNMQSSPITSEGDPELILTEFSDPENDAVIPQSLIHRKVIPSRSAMNSFSRKVTKWRRYFRLQLKMIRPWCLIDLLMIVMIVFHLRKILTGDRHLLLQLTVI